MKQMDGATAAKAVETSVIVRTFNEERHLPALFDALDAQAYRDFEVVVVDSGSVDRTRDIAVARGARLIRIAKHDFTFGYSLNVGIKGSRGRFLALVSAHTVPADSGWLANLVEPLRDDETAMTYGRQLGVAASKFGEAEDFKRIFGTEALDLVPPHFFANNANSAVRRDLWEVYPFDEELTGLEDIDFAKHWMEKGYRVRYQPDAPLYHIHEETWPQVHRRYYREAVAARRIGIKGRRNVPGEVIRETAWLCADLVHALSPADNPVAGRLSLWGRLAEVARFRVNKAVGTVRGLMEAHPMETRDETESYLFDRTGRAVVVEAPGRATLKDVPIPEIKPGEALIRVAHVGVCATDLEILEGRLGYFKNGLGKYPIVPGHEFSGHVVAVGQNVTDLGEHDPVVVECIQSCHACEECRSGNFIGCAERTELGVLRKDGAYGDYVVAPARFVHKVPAGIDMRMAALAEPVAVVMKGLRRLGRVLREDPASHRAAVVGAGPLGHICARILERRGFQVVTIDKSETRAAFFEGTAVEGTTDMGRLGGCDVIVELTGSPAALHSVLHDSPAGAAILLLGLPYGERAFSFENIAAYDKTVIGSVGSTAEDFQAALAELGGLSLDHHLENAFALEDFEEAWRASRRPEVLKAIIDVEPRG